MKEVYTLEQAAEHLGIPRRTFYVWKERGLIPTTPVGRGRNVMLANQVRLVGAVLAAEGRKGVLSGVCKG